MTNYITKTKKIKKIKKNKKTIIKQKGGTNGKKNGPNGNSFLNITQLDLFKQKYSPSNNTEFLGFDVLDYEKIYDDLNTDIKIKLKEIKSKLEEYMKLKLYQLTELNIITPNNQITNNEENSLSDKTEIINFDIDKIKIYIKNIEDMEKTFTTV